MTVASITSESVIRIMSWANAECADSMHMAAATKEKSNFFIISVFLIAGTNLRKTFVFSTYWNNKYTAPTFKTSYPSICDKYHNYLQKDYDICSMRYFGIADDSGAYRTNYFPGK